MKLLTESIKEKIPALGTTEKIPLQDKTIVCKFFHPLSNWTWFAVEGERQGDDFIFFGYVIGFEKEWGYFSLNDLESIKKPLPLERDLHFKPCKYSELPEHFRK